MNSENKKERFTQQYDYKYTHEHEYIKIQENRKNTHIYIYIYGGFPKIGVPLNHVF